MTKRISPDAGLLMYWLKVYAPTTWWSFEIIRSVACCRKQRIPGCKTGPGRGAGTIADDGSQPLPRKGGDNMSKEEILKALEDEDLKKQLLEKLEEELEVEELEDRIATKPWLCYMPVP